MMASHDDNTAAMPPRTSLSADTLPFLVHCQMSCAKGAR